MRRALATGLLAAFFLAEGCGGQTESACIEGQESCACLDDATCHGGLSCVDHSCRAVATGGSHSIAGIGGSNSVGGAGAVASTELTLDYCGGLLVGSTCSQTTLWKDLTETSVLLVIDDSGSMRDAPSAVSSSTKWSILNQALTSVMAMYQGRINFGLELFPYAPNGIDTSTSEGSCNVPLTSINYEITTGTTSVPWIASFLPGVVPAGGTPTSKALEEVYRYFTQGNGKVLVGTKHVMLITDGGPNCNLGIQCNANTCTQNLDGKCGSGVGTTLNCCDTSTAAGAATKANLSCLDDTATITQLEGLQAAGIGTFVVGLPGAEPYASTLNAMANAGGKTTNNTLGTSYYAVSPGSTQADLISTVNGILDQLTNTCDFELRSTPANPAAVKVVYDCQFVPMLLNNSPASDGGFPNGFYIDYTRTPAHVVLTGTYCDRVLTLGAGQLDLIEGCVNSH